MILGGVVQILRESCVALDTSFKFVECAASISWGQHALQPKTGCTTSTLCSLPVFSGFDCECIGIRQHKDFVLQRVLLSRTAPHRVLWVDNVTGGRLGDVSRLAFGPVPATCLLLKILL